MIMKNKQILKKLSLLPTISILCGSFLLSACSDQVAAVLEGQEARAERYHEEGKAVGNACRHAGRAIEDCYTIYSWLPRSGIFEGWREMDKYMRKYSLETVKPVLPPPENPNAPKKEESPKKKKKKSADKDKDKAAETSNETANTTNAPATATPDAGGVSMSAADVNKDAEISKVVATPTSENSAQYGEKK